MMAETYEANGRHVKSRPKNILNMPSALTFVNLINYGYNNCYSIVTDIKVFALNYSIKIATRYNTVLVRCCVCIRHPQGYFCKRTAIVIGKHGRLTFQETCKCSPEQWASPVLFSRKVTFRFLLAGATGGDSGDEMLSMSSGDRFSLDKEDTKMPRKAAKAWPRSLSL